MTGDIRCARRRRIANFLAALAVLLLALPARADVARPVHERRLANGLRVLVSPDPMGADVSLLVQYDVGSRDEPTGLEGIAHLVEHLMFTGSKHVPRGKLAELLEEAGAANVNGRTGFDVTTYHETLPPERLELGLWLESDRMGYLLDNLDEAGFRLALREVDNEYRDRVLEVPVGNERTVLLGELFPAWHPYHHLPVGTPAAIGGGIKLADARAFAATWYGPANAVVAIAGKVDPAAALALAERYFGSLPPRPPPPRPALPALARSASTLAQVRAGVARAQVRIGWVTPAQWTRDDIALDVAASILAGRGAGWLHKALTGDPRLCMAVTAQESSMTLASVFEIQAIVADGHTPEEVLERIRTTIARFETGLTDDETERAKRIWHNANLFRLESSLAWAEGLAAEARRGPVPPRFDALLSTHASVRADEVRSAVRTWLARPGVVVFSRPYRGAPLSGLLYETRGVSP